MELNGVRLLPQRVKRATLLWSRGWYMLTRPYGMQKWAQTTVDAKVVKRQMQHPNQSSPTKMHSD